MKKRGVLRIEQLEARVTPDVSLCPAVLPLPPLPAKLAGPADDPFGSPHTSEQADALSAPTLDTIFSSPEELQKLLGPAAVPSARQPEPAGWHFLWNYARKAIRNEELHYGTLPDHED